jgi:hypothetical protein
MPVIADTRVLPQALEATWEKLAAEASQMRNAESGVRNPSEMPNVGA